MVRWGTLKLRKLLNWSWCDSRQTGTDPLDILTNPSYITFVPETTTMLTGITLLNKVTEMQAQNPPAKMSEIVRACGYELEGKLKYTQFYTELLTVKGLINNDTLENDEISEEYQEQYQNLCEEFGKDAVQAFLELYTEEDLQYFQDAYQGRYEDEAEFAEQFTNDVYGIDIPSFVVIDWDATWNCNLRYDFDFEDGFVFNKNF